MSKVGLEDKGNQPVQDYVFVINIEQRVENQCGSSRAVCRWGSRSPGSTGTLFDLALLCRVV